MYKIIITNGRYQNTFRAILKERFIVLGIFSFWLHLDRCPDASLSGLFHHVEYWRMQFGITDDQIQDVSEEKIWDI